MSQSKQIGVRAFREEMSRYLAEVRAGTELTIVSRGKPVAELKPPTKHAVRPSPIFGALKGKIWIADDFDEPDTDFNAAYYGDH